jgi:hypothetical protein
MRAVRLAGTIVFAAAAMAGAQGSAHDVRVTAPACVPVEGNGVVSATVAPEVPGSTVRLYFRRMSLEVEDFYSVAMEPLGGGLYWGLLPDAEDQPATRKDLAGNPAPANAWAAWWKAKEASENRDPNGDLNAAVIKERASLGKLEPRTWMDGMPDAQLESWLVSLRNEPVEYFVAVTDHDGKRVGFSEMKVTPVSADCTVALTPQQKGFAENMTLGETAVWQKGQPPFHWECDGIVTRYDTTRTRRAHEFCRACVVR